MTRTEKLVPFRGMKPGVKVVCVDDKFSIEALLRSSGLPVAGRIYVVRGIRNRVGVGWPGPAPFGIYLVGITNDFDTQSGNEIGFDPRRFRLLEEMKSKSAEQQEVKCS